MKLINNQAANLLAVLKQIISNQSEVYITFGYLTIPVIFEVIDQLFQVNSIKVLVDDPDLKNKQEKYGL